MKKQQLPFLKRLLCARRRAKRFTSMTTVRLHLQPGDVEVRASGTDKEATVRGAKKLAPYPYRILPQSGVPFT